MRRTSMKQLLIVSALLLGISQPAFAQGVLGRLGKAADKVKGAADKLNDLVVSDNYIQPLLARSRVTALKNGLTAHLSGWDSDLWQLANWYREA